MNGAVVLRTLITDLLQLISTLRSGHESRMSYGLFNSFNYCISGYSLIISIITYLSVSSNISNNVAFTSIFNAQLAAWLFAILALCIVFEFTAEHKCGCIY